LALIDPDSVTRHDIPHEPGEWMEIRSLCAGDLRSRNRDSDNVSLSLDLLAHAVRGWSYGGAITADTLAKLDLKTYEWLQETVSKSAGLRTEDEKNASGASSSPTTERVAAPSLMSSGT
jgi:hypothetical protein